MSAGNQYSMREIMGDTAATNGGKARPTANFRKNSGTIQRRGKDNRDPQGHRAPYERHVNNRDQGPKPLTQDRNLQSNAAGARPRPESHFKKRDDMSTPETRLRRLMMRA